MKVPTKGTAYFNAYSSFHLQILKFSRITFLDKVSDIMGHKNIISFLRDIVAYWGFHYCAALKYFNPLLTYYLYRRKTINISFLKKMAFFTGMCDL